jgi:hypothetical protein
MLYPKLLEWMRRPQQPWRQVPIIFASLLLVLGSVGTWASFPLYAQEAPAVLTPSPMPSPPATDTPPEETPLPTATTPPAPATATPEPVSIVTPPPVGPPPVAVPEPITIILFASGLATLGAGVMAKRRRS